MLVLGRKPKEIVRIGEDITVHVTSVDAYTGYVKLGFVAPPGVIIDREEVYQRKKHGINIPKHLSEEDIKCQLLHNTK